MNFWWGSLPDDAVPNPELSHSVLAVERPSLEPVPARM